MSIWLSGHAELVDENRRLARKLLHLWVTALALAWLAEAPITWLNDWADWVGRHVPVVHHLYNRPGDIAAVVARFYGLVCGIAPVGVTYLLVGDDPLRHLQIGPRRLRGRYGRADTNRSLCAAVLGAALPLGLVHRGAPAGGILVLLGHRQGMASGSTVPRAGPLRG